LRKWIWSATFSASCALSRHSHTRMRSPSAWSLHSVFGMFVRVVGDQRVRRAQHAIAAAVVLFELDDLQRGVVGAERQQVVRVSRRARRRSTGRRRPRT
jgi:hypothetical protein